jgi:hypothetical protein
MPNALGLLAEPQMRATPRNKLMGLLADALQGAQDYAQRPDPRMPGGKANPVLGLLADAASLQSLATTAQRVSYGEPLTNKGKANVPFLRPETADVAMMAPLSPRNALAALGMVGGFGDDAAMRAATVWHGSPHKFNKFDASKIGTGEGNQAYGNGLYLAGAQATGQSYKDTLRGMRTDTKDVVSNLMPDRHFTTKERAEIFKAAMEESKPVEVAARQLGYRQASIRDVPQDVLRQAVERVREQGQGYLYKVDLPDDQIARMLDWDAPLSKQPANVQQALGPKVVQRDGGWYVDSGPKKGSWKFTSEAEAASEARQAALSRDMTGSALHDSLKTGADAETAQMLRQLGIPGIRYLDGGSRGAGQGSSNFVVFPGNEDLLTILERNGQPLK